jgi:hypothetical protein
VPGQRQRRQPQPRRPALGPVIKVLQSRPRQLDPAASSSAWASVRLPAAVRPRPSRPGRAPPSVPVPARTRWRWPAARRPPRSTAAAGRPRPVPPPWRSAGRAPPRRSRSGAGPSCRSPGGRHLHDALRLCQPAEQTRARDNTIPDSRAVGGPGQSGKLHGGSPRQAPVQQYAEAAANHPAV